MKKHNSILLLGMLALLVLVTGCAQSINEIKDDRYVGETITVRGTVAESVKIGSLSGYTLQDSSGERIAVSTEELPAEGSSVRVTGTLMKDTIFGYYIKPD